MKPLAERMRPLVPDDYFGQQQLMGKEAPFRKLLEQGHIHSCIFWGPPGVGKTSLARLLSEFTDRPMIALSAINSGIKEVREAIDQASKRNLFSTKNPILFIDEIHRFNKTQQDALLEAVEKGIIVLIGATTENPSFEINHALLSRCQVYILEDLSADELKQMVTAALLKDDVLKQRNITIEEFDALIMFSGGDARKLYNIIELLVNAVPLHEPVIINNSIVEESIRSKPLAYDKDGEYHYDIISAFIKSVRGSDPNAAVYWLARMIEGGEDPMFICRRMVILASEDIGLANPNALLLANTCMDAVKKIGMPEGRIVMSETVIYLACSPKSNSAYVAINKALDLVKKTGNLPVPLHLRNAPTKLMKSLNYGNGYQYAHDFDQNFVSQAYLPDQLAEIKFYEPANNPAEEKYKSILGQFWSKKYGK